MIPEITYCDRNSGQMMTERVYAGAFLIWTYNSRLGKQLERAILRQKLSSRLYGWIYETAWSRRFIAPFVQAMEIKMEESVKSMGEFISFNDFFRREINPAYRPIAGDPSLCIAPADGKVLAYPSVDVNTAFRIKSHTFQLRSFLVDDELAQRFENGSMVISRLCLRDYHHFHFPDSGKPHSPRSINGCLHAGGPYALSDLVPFYSENYRMLTLFDSDHFGTIALVEIGAFTVGSIRQAFRPDCHVAKGEHKGLFELGGSTVVMLFQNGVIQLDSDLCRNTKLGVETFVQYGESVGSSLT